MYYACCTSRGWATHRRRLSVLTQAQECSTKGWQQRREGRKHLSFVVILSFLVELQQNQLFFLAKYYQLLNRKLPIRHDLTYEIWLLPEMRRQNARLWSIKELERRLRMRKICLWNWQIIQRKLRNHSEIHKNISERKTQNHSDKSPQQILARQIFHAIKIRCLFP